MPITKLTVKYINPQHDIDVNLDEEIIKAFENLGFTWLWCGSESGRTIDFKKEQVR